MAKIDATANDIDPKYGGVNMYPTIKYFPAHDKDHPIEWLGKEKALDSFLQFIQQHNR